MLPTPAYQGGVLDLVSPIRFQRDLTSPWSLTLAGSVRVRETFSRVNNGEGLHGSSGLMQILVGGGIRMERPLKRVRVGFSFDLLAQPARALPPAVSGGIGLSWMRNTAPIKRGRKGRER